MDTFNCPPIVTTESVVSIRRKFSKLTEFKKTSPEKTNGGLVTCDSPATTEHLNVNELSSSIPLSSFYVCPSLIDALPDPPRLSVQGLVDMHRKMTAWKSDKCGIIESGNEELLNTTKLLKEEAICDKQLVSGRNNERVKMKGNTRLYFWNSF
uniref:Uncharacterized protein n=1 Tax=Heterorhabditis bacteriophora TaxID=37862 RepID=A0A1I7XRM2_HETBA